MSTTFLVMRWVEEVGALVSATVSKIVVHVSASVFPLDLAFDSVGQA